MGGRFLSCILSINYAGRQDFLARGHNLRHRQVGEAAGLRAVALETGAEIQAQAHDLVPGPERPGAPGCGGAENRHYLSPQGRGQLRDPGQPLLGRSEHFRPAVELGQGEERIARAALESIAFQSAALLEAMSRDAVAAGGAPVSGVSVTFTRQGNTSSPPLTDVNGYTCVTLGKSQIYDENVTATASKSGFQNGTTNANTIGGGSGGCP